MAGCFCKVTSGWRTPARQKLTSLFSFLNRLYKTHWSENKTKKILISVLSMLSVANTLLPQKGLLANASAPGTTLPGKRNFRKSRLSRTSRVAMENLPKKKLDLGYRIVIQPPPPNSLDFPDFRKLPSINARTEWNRPPIDTGRQLSTAYWHPNDTLSTPKNPRFAPSCNRLISYTAPLLSTRVDSYWHE